MYNVIHIGDKEVPMLSMASVDYYYKNIFHEDPIKLQVSDNNDVATMLSFMQRMAFVMAKFAESTDRKNMMKLNEEAFLEWADGFERNELIEALPDIQSTYEGQSLTGSTAKKNNDQPSGE